MVAQRRIAAFVIVAALVFCLSGTGATVTQAAASPSIQITGGIANSCDSSHYDLPVFFNLVNDASDSVLVSVPGAGNFNFSEDESHTVAAITYGIDFASFSVPAHTPITVTITTYFGLSETGGVSFVSTVAYDCTTGAVLGLGNGVTWFTPGDGRSDGQPGDRIVVYCNASQNPANIDIWVIDGSSIGHELTRLNLSNLTAVPAGQFSKNLGANGVIFAGSDAAGNTYAALQGGPYGGTAQGNWLKSFSCKASS